MNRLTNERRTSAIACLVEGNSQRATCRMTGLAKKTVGRLAVETGIGSGIVYRLGVNIFATCKEAEDSIHKEL